MKPKGLAKQYAKALFDVTRMHGSSEAVARDLSELAALVDAQPELAAAFRSRAIPSGTKRRLVDALLASASGVTPEVGKFLRVLADADELERIGDVAAAFADRAGDVARAVPASVRTAIPLSEAERATLERALGQAVGRPVTVTYDVDSSLIGGAVARVGSMVFDGSVARQLERMRQELLAEA